MPRRRKKSKPVAPRIAHKYIINARCVWWDRDVGATTHSNPTIHVTATDPAKAVDEAYAQIKAQAGSRRELHGFQVNYMTDRGPATGEEETTCTIGLL